MSKQAGLFDARDGDFEGSSVAFLVDSACISASGLFFGTSPCTPFVESASGIGEGGKTGITAIATAFWFFISIFFSPILSNIPSWATGSVLVIVGAFMMENAARINWDYMGDSIPAFIVLATIPFTYPYNVTAMIKQQDTHGKSRFFALLPPWMRKMLSGNKRFWAYTPEEIQRRLEGRQMTQESGNAAAELRQKERDGLRIMMGIHFRRPDSPERTPEDVEVGHQAYAMAEQQSASIDSKHS
ncbi:hypothetical protein IAU60_001211 [Kwoniella sp. DSM 27419]